MNPWVKKQFWPKSLGKKILQDTRAKEALTLIQIKPLLTNFQSTPYLLLKSSDHVAPRKKLERCKDFTEGREQSYDQSQQSCNPILLIDKVNTLILFLMRFSPQPRVMTISFQEKVSLIRDHIATSYGSTSDLLSKFAMKICMM